MKRKIQEVERGNEKEENIKEKGRDMGGGEKGH